MPNHALLILVHFDNGVIGNQSLHVDLRRRDVQRVGVFYVPARPVHERRHHEAGEGGLLEQIAIDDLHAALLVGTLLVKRVMPVFVGRSAKVIKR